MSPNLRALRRWEIQQTGKRLRYISGSCLHLKLIILLGFLSIAFLLSGCVSQAEFGASVTSGEAPFTVSFSNTTKTFLVMNVDEFQWDFGDGANMTTSTTEETVTHEYTKAGTHTVTLTAVKKGEPPKTSTMTLAIAVNHGPLDRVKLNPEMVELDIGQSQKFSAEAVDAYDNPIAEAQLTWEKAEAVGSVTDGGILTAGTKAGTFDKGVVVTAKLNTHSAKDTASVTVNPDPLEAVTIPPIEVAAGETQQLEPVATDQYGNRVSEIEVAWTLTDEDVGSVTEAGLITANEVAGTFDDVVEVQVTQGELVRSAVAPVTIMPGKLEQVVIAPNLADIGIEMTQQFVAVGADRYGNRISGLAFTWSTQNSGGIIDANGLFTAGDTPGRYNDAISAEATVGNITRSATASVKIEPDRIVFFSDREDEQFDIYIMNVNGSNQERLTTSNIDERSPSCSPDGRRIIYHAEGDILMINDDSTWNIAILSGRKAYEPAWSPDGSKITFQSWEHDPDRSEGNSEIYVMDVDGGNLVRLTENSAYDDYPGWSPDGTKIAFVSARDGNPEIYVMNADGSNQRRLTKHGDADTFPAWSPGGTEILFQSDREGRGIYIMNADGTDVRRLTSEGYASNHPYWSPDGAQIVFHSYKDVKEKAEIYIMDRDGSNMTRLTDNSANDWGPVWVPRKRGVQVTEASVIIPDASTLKAMMVQEVTARARKAVVRIKTDLGSGSGFIINPGGLILTNNHMIRDAEEITVYLQDGTSYAGIVEARDLVRDLALVKIEAAELPYLELGDLSQVGLGQQVVVLGYPLKAEEIAVTSGLVSSIQFDSGRNITWVQTDSAINPGNSGGPMLNLQGQVIGVVSAKMVGVAVEGMGFAISANTVNMYLPRLEAGEVIMTFR